MTDNQRFVAAADLLTGPRDGKAPKDALIHTFQEGVTEARLIDSLSVVEVAAGLCLTQESRFAA